MEQAHSLRHVARQYADIPYITPLPSTSARHKDTQSTNSSSSERQTSVTPTIVQQYELSSDTASSSTITGGGGNIPLEIIRVSLFKDKEYNDFGFSVSDGVNEKGVFINKIRPGGPADLIGNVKPYDRILQVNNQGLEMIDCILAVPLLLSATDRIDLLLCRDPQFVGAVLERERQQQQAASVIVEEDENDSSSSMMSELKDSAV